MPDPDVSGSLRLSRNELLALLRRVFEALFAKSCDYEALAEQIVWLECHGLGGLDLLHDCLAPLDREEHHGERLLLDACLAQGALIDLDADGESLICFGDLLADVAIARCARHETCKVEITNLREGQAIVPQIHRMAMAGRFAAARVTNRKSGKSWYAQVTGSSPLPELYGWDGAKDCGERVALSLVCSANEQALLSAIMDLYPNWPEPTMSAGQLARNYRDCLNNGVLVRDLTALHAIADRVLVEATEESRRGAGE